MSASCVPCILLTLLPTLLPPAAAAAASFTTAGALLGDLMLLRTGGWSWAMLSSVLLRAQVDDAVQYTAL